MKKILFLLFYLSLGVCAVAQSETKNRVKKAIRTAKKAGLDVKGKNDEGRALVASQGGTDRENRLYEKAKKAEAILKANGIEITEEKSGDAKSKKALSSEEKADKETTENVSAYHLVYMNGANFDFKSDLSTTYVGHLNVFAPVLRNLSPEKRKARWRNGRYALGINAGLFKINYNDADTASVSTYNMKVVLNPIQGVPQSGDQYLRQRVKHSRLSKLSSYSMYIQPMICLSGDDAPNKIMIHGHAELLVNSFQTNNEYVVLAQDTQIHNGSDTVIYAPENGSLRSIFDDSYLGLGITSQLRPWKKGYLFTQLTIGATNSDATETTSMVIRGKGATNNKGFYLIRSYYTHTLTDASSIIIGADIRGFIKNRNHMWGTYVGLNVDIASLATLLLGGKSSTDNNQTTKEKTVDVTPSTDLQKPPADKLKPVVE